MSGGRTFARRVARAMAATAVLSALLSAVLTTAIAWTSLLDREDDRLRGAAQTLGLEVPATMDEATARGHADDEQAEVAVAGMRIALYRSGRFVGGDASLRPSAADGCRTTGRGWRQCRVTLPTGAVEVTSDLAAARSQRSLLLGAALLAALLAGLAGLGLSGAVSARIARPLQRLREEVAAVDADAPGRALPGGGDGYAETDALRASLGEMLSRLDEALSQSRRFAANAAHELRTPLGNMQAELELSAEGALPEEVRDSQRRVLCTLGGLNALVERLLILAAPVESLRGAREAVSLSDVVEEVLAALDPAARQRVRSAVDEGLHVRGDALLLRVMLENVVGNALKFAPTGEVTVRAQADGDAVTLEVTDEGPGVAQCDRERVFDAFYRSAGARAEGVRGHGVGLALVARIARAHGGSAAFVDAPAGARLMLRLPRWAPAERDATMRVL
ncbi:MAG: HAMP domain-containing histidine kinase [Deltaproteobacteria bacterium]|nr:HAMP domain-containing histidine kinase [Deltaproteobacteria bacterium]